MVLEELIKEFHEDKTLHQLDKELMEAFSWDIKDLLIYDYERPDYEMKNLTILYNKVESELVEILKKLKIDDFKTKAESFLSTLPKIRKTLNTSIQAILEGDPASFSKQQIVLEYPGFEAILFYRVAHEFYLLDLPLVCRFISELAHRHTGIDINPGARIGDYFFIDHGTGIVIGETCIIGKNVKLYQGVTLGALSLKKGRDLIGKKRHPTVEDNCTIYSNAAIFGGDTIIGEGSTIGGDVYLTHSVPPYSIVLQTDKYLTILNKQEFSK